MELSMTIGICVYILKVNNIFLRKIALWAKTMFPAYGKPWRWAETPFPTLW